MHRQLLQRIDAESASTQNISGIGSWQCTFCVGELCMFDLRVWQHKVQVGNLSLRFGGL